MTTVENATETVAIRDLSKGDVFIWEGDVRPALNTSDLNTPKTVVALHDNVIWYTNAEDREIMMQGADEGSNGHSHYSGYDQMDWSTEHLTARAVGFDRRVIRLEKSTETQTMRQFFRSLSRYAYVTTPGSTERYVFWNFGQNDEGKDELTLIAERWADPVVWTGEELDAENRWEAIRNDTGGFETPDIGWIRLVRRNLDLQREYNYLVKTLSETRDTHAKVMADFRTVNDKLCEFAVEKGYCPEFEEVIGQWNEELDELELLGRPRSLRVEVHINGQAFNIYKEARSIGEARELVSRMSTRSVIEELINNGNYFDDWEVTVVGAAEDS